MWGRNLHGNTCTSIMQIDRLKYNFPYFPGLSGLVCNYGNDSQFVLFSSLPAATSGNLLTVSLKVCVQSC